ncbi:glycosyltransferase family 4 protein [Paenibacillus tarimensis]
MRLRNKIKKSAKTRSGRRTASAVRVGKNRKRRSRSRSFPVAIVPIQRKPSTADQPSFMKDPALLPGVNLVGLMYHEMGIGESCRLAARALSTTDVPFGMLNLPLNTVIRETDFSWQHREVKDPVYNTNIIHLNADTLHYASSHFGDLLFGRRYNIGYWHWELPDFPEEFMGGFDLLNEVWVPSSFVQDSISRKSKVPVVRIPHGVEVSYRPDMGRGTFGLPDERFLFLSMFDTQSYMRRKNPEGAIQAFKMAFDRDDTSAGLIVKLNNAEARPGDLENVRQLVDGYKNIYILDQVLSREEVNSLIHCTDSFVSLHRAEGFGLGLAEAMALGKPVIGTDWSGNTDFMNPMNSCLVKYTLSKVGEDWGPYKGYQTWAEPDLEHAASHMKKLVELPEWRNSIAAMGKETIETHFSPRAAGELIKQRLHRLNMIG